jgi:hypothetical protein
MTTEIQGYLNKAAKYIQSARVLLKEGAPPGVEAFFSDRVLALVAQMGYNQ